MEDVERYLGMPIIIAFEHDLGDPIRRHRKRRIAKKWLKKYGVHTIGLAPMSVNVVNNKIYMSRKTYYAIKGMMKTLPKVHAVFHHWNAFPHEHLDHDIGLRGVELSNIVQRYMR